jgi:hypothetical protein
MALLTAKNPATGRSNVYHRAHACSIFKGDSDQAAAFVPHIVGGLMRNDRCVYVSDSLQREDLFDRIASEASVSQEVLETHITFLSADEVYLKSGRFEKERMLRFIADARDQALREGFCGLTATGEMSWAGRGAPGPSDLIDYEARINFMYPDSASDILCQYPESDFDTATLVNAVRAHPKVHVRGMVCGNPYYLPPETLISFVSGVVGPEVLEHMEREMFKASVLSEIAALESKDLRRASLCQDVFDEMVLGHFPDELEAAIFMHEMALSASKDEGISAHIRSADSKCRELMDRLEAMKAFGACVNAHSEWQPLGDVVHRAAESAFGGSRKVTCDLGDHAVYASSSMDKALTAVMNAVSERVPKSSPIEAKAVRSPFGLTVTIGASGDGVPEGSKESLFGASEPCVCGRSLFLAREVMELTGTSIREVGIPGKSVVFQIDVPLKNCRGQ